jgi:hypothetical protein
MNALLVNGPKKYSKIAPPPPAPPQKKNLYFRYEADAYCSDKGGFLAEPVSSAENDFLKGQARQHPNTNWWTGLRESEDCKCSSNDARAAIQFEANIGMYQ